MHSRHQLNVHQIKIMLRVFASDATSTPLCYARHPLSFCCYCIKGLANNPFVMHLRPTELHWFYIQAWINNLNRWLTTSSGRCWWQATCGISLFTVCDSPDVLVLFNMQHHIQEVLLEDDKYRAKTKQTCSIQSNRRHKLGSDKI